MPVWLGILIAAMTAIGGGSGVAAIIKARSDSKQGVDAHELAEDDALQERWQKLAEAQLKLLLEPLQLQLTDLTAKVAKLELEITETRTKYWKAIAYVRTLNSWIAKHVTDPDLVPPAPPADLVGDI